MENLAKGEASPLKSMTFSENRGRWGTLDFNWRGLVVAGWLAGIGLLLCFRVAGGLRFRAFKLRSRVASSDRLVSLVRRITSQNHLDVELRESNNAPSPMTWGIWRPVILLPFRAREWSDDHLTAALLHECGHIRRRDCLTRLLAQAASTIFWMNPLVWVALRRLHVEQEIACDNLVLGAGIGATDYATQLVALVRSVERISAYTPHALAMVNPSTLETRVRSIVEERQNRRPLTKVDIAASMASVAAILMLFTFTQLRAAENPPPNDGIKPEKTPVDPAGDARPAPFGDTPIEITSIDTHMENGIAIAMGRAVLKWGILTIKGDVIKYDPQTREVTVIGHSEIDARPAQAVVIHGEYLVYNLDFQKLVSHGQTSTSIQTPASTSTPGH